MEQYSEQYSKTIATIFAAADEEPGRPNRRRPGFRRRQTLGQ
jgi:hypothetical protein